MTTQATDPSLRETLREVDAAIAEIIRAEVADPAERERLLAKLAALSQPAASVSLDVELLARALRAIEDRQGIWWGPAVGEDPCLAKARDIITAYNAIPAMDAFSQSWPPITTHNAPRTDLPATDREQS